MFYLPVTIQTDQSGSSEKGRGGATARVQSSADKGNTITVRGYSLLLRGPLDTVFPLPVSGGIGLIPGTAAGTTDQLFPLVL